MKTVGKEYWTVNAPYRLPRAERREIMAKLKAEFPDYARLQGRNTLKEADALAERVKAAFGFDMEVNRTQDLGL